jgi:hypothetical protein
VPKKQEQQFVVLFTAYFDFSLTKIRMVLFWELILEPLKDLLCVIKIVKKFIILPPIFIAVELVLLLTLKIPLVRDSFRQLTFSSYLFSTGITSFVYWPTV